MDFAEGLKKFKDRNKFSNAELSRMLGVSDSAVNQYLKGKSGVSVNILASLLRNGMKLEEAFDKETAEIIEKMVLEKYRLSTSGRPMDLVVNGLKDILSSIDKTESV